MAASIAACADADTPPPPPPQATGQWYEIQDLHVQETMPQLIGLSQSYMMVYERRDQAPALPGDGGGGGGSAEATGAA